MYALSARPSIEAILLATDYCAYGNSAKGRDTTDIHDLGHLLAVGLGVEGGLSEQDGVLLGGDAELVVEGVVPVCVVWVWVQGGCGWVGRCVRV